ncbi:unnamed protein product [Thlaspi arvense]|uniref:FBD domain-containing protein n=1 Tax=Thlaspi arvense TaxID=13288 RepID=A0AAU9TAG0_THLAR|nr:unnamed protein product [Thlaspi arvense]
MDWISELPDALLLTTLFLLPCAKDVADTMVLSKRWQFLWMHVPKLVYDDRKIARGRFITFVFSSLLRREGPQALHFKLVRNYCDIGFSLYSWVWTHLRELIIEIDSSSSIKSQVTLSTRCRMLVTLKLRFVKRFLSNCHVLEDLHVEQCRDDNVTIFTVIVPSLKSLSLHTVGRYIINDKEGFVIDAPSLECLTISDESGGFCIIENDLPKIVTASLSLWYVDPWKILGSITSVKRLDLCLACTENAYHVGCVFKSLERLKICTCDEKWLNLLMCLLRDSPNLKALRIEECHEACDDACWNEPSSVPKCVLSSLETLEWVKYKGAKEEKELVAYILRNANCLKKVFKYLSSYIRLKLEKKKRSEEAGEDEEFSEVVEKINGEETGRKRVGKMQRMKKEKVSDVDSSELQAIPSEKPKVKKVESEKKMQKSKRKTEDINSSPVDVNVNKKKIQKKRKSKGDNIDTNEHSQITPEAISNEKIKGKKGKLNKTKKKRKAEEISSGPVDEDDDHLRQEDDGDKSSIEAVNADNGTAIRNRKSKKSKKNKKMNLTTAKENERSSEKMNEIEEEEDVYQISSGDEDCSRGMKKWLTDYSESRPGLDELQTRIDDFMTAHEERLEQEKQNREAKAAEGGWTVVVHHKGRKKTTEAESGIAVGSVSQAALEDKVAKKKQSEPVAHGFYRFQRREAQRSELLALQSKFEQDKKRIQQLRAARKFKPY